MSMLCGYFNFNLHAFAWKLTLQAYRRGKGTCVVSRHNWDWTPTNSETSVTFRNSGEAGFPLPEGKYCNRREHKAPCMQAAERRSPATLPAIHLCVSLCRGGVRRISLPLNHEQCFWGLLGHWWHRTWSKDHFQPAMWSLVLLTCSQELWVLARLHRTFLAPGFSMASRPPRTLEPPETLLRPQTELWTWTCAMEAHHSWKAQPRSEDQANSNYAEFCSK